MKSPRRSISLRGITHQRVKNYCKARGISLSAFLEELVAEKLDAAGVPVPDKLEEPIKKAKADVKTDEIISQHFTF